MIAKNLTGSRQQIPKKWTFANGATTGNFDALNEKTHNAEGWIWCDPDPTFDPATHKLGDDQLVNNRWTRAVVGKTPADLAADLAIAINAKYQEITLAYQAADRAIFAGYTPEQQKTFYKQEAEARAWLADNTAATPFLDGMVTTGWRTKAELVVGIIAKAEALAPVYGATLEKYQYLLDQLAGIDPAGDPAAERVRLAAIIW